MNVSDGKIPEKHMGEKTAYLSLKSIGTGFHLLATITSYIAAPLIIFGGIGLWLVKEKGAHKLVFIGLILFSFIVSNAIIYKQAKKIASKIAS